MQFSCLILGVFIVGCVALSAASSVGYSHVEDVDRFEPVATIDSESVMQANDKEYLVKKTANLVDLFYETGIPKRIARLVRFGGAFLENRSGDGTFSEMNEIFEGRKKDKGGLGVVMMMGLMMAKMVGALGFAGVGALAAKALGVSLMALMLSAVVGLKKLSEGGHGGGHSDHHRRRRDLDDAESKGTHADFLPYWAWLKQD